MKCAKAVVVIVGAAFCGCLVSVLLFSGIGSGDDYGAPSRFAGGAAGSDSDEDVVGRIKPIEEVPVDFAPYEETVSQEQEEEPSDEPEEQEQLTEEEKRKAAAEARWDKAIEKCEALQDAEERLYTRSDDDLLNWDEQDLLRAFQDAGLANVSVEVLAFHREQRLTMQQLRRWFEQRKDSYAGRLLQAGLTPTDVQRLQDALLSLVSGQTVSWETKVAFLRAH